MNGALSVCDSDGDRWALTAEQAEARQGDAGLPMLSLAALGLGGLGGAEPAPLCLHP
jgi:hypothetical protein